jgi:hypothetical protein
LGGKDLCFDELPVVGGLGTLVISDGWVTSKRTEGVLNTFVAEDRNGDSMAIGGGEDRFAKLWLNSSTP